MYMNYQIQEGGAARVKASAEELKKKAEKKKNKGASPAKIENSSGDSGSAGGK